MVSQLCCTDLQNFTRTGHSVFKDNFSYLLNINISGLCDTTADYDQFRVKYIDITGQTAPKIVYGILYGFCGTFIILGMFVDTMTIILVFLLKSYSANPVQLKGGDDLKLPFSSAEQEPGESTAITVTLNNIIVTDAAVATLDKGEVAASDLSGGDFMIDPLFEARQQEVDKQKKIEKFNKKAKFTEVVTIIADRNVPFSLLSKVMYTAGQASFSKFKFAVVKRGA